MKVVELRRRRPEDGAVQRLLRVYVREPGQPAEFDLLAPERADGMRSLLAEGIPDGHGRQLHLSDGDQFLAALVQAYNGSRYWAQVVEENEEG
ncbi:MAG: hypothetical protein H0V73_12775 [Chloroflexi bacterium]|nr:hypothetical protein [Chloroflexota bacterium]